MWARAKPAEKCDAVGQFFQGRPVGLGSGRSEPHPEARCGRERRFRALARPVGRQGAKDLSIWGEVECAAGRPVGPPTTPDAVPCLALKEPHLWCRCICVRNEGTGAWRYAASSVRNGGTEITFSAVDCPKRGDRVSEMRGLCFAVSGVHFMNAFDGRSPLRSHLNWVSRHSVA